MVAPDIVRQLVAQHPPHLAIQPEAIIAVGPKAELDRLACIDIQAKQVRLLVRGEFREHTHGKVVLLHDMPDGRVVREASQQSARGFGLGEVSKRFDAVKGILGGRRRRRTSGADLTRPSATL